VARELFLDGGGAEKINAKRGPCILAQKTVFSKIRSSSNLDSIFGPEYSSPERHRSLREAKILPEGTCPQLPAPLRQLHVKCLKQCYKCLQNYFGNTGAQQRYQWPKHFNLKIEKVFFVSFNQRCGSSRIFFASASSSSSSVMLPSSLPLPHSWDFMLPLPAPDKVGRFRVRFRFQLILYKRFHFLQNFTAFSFRFLRFLSNCMLTAQHKSENLLC